jgi:hypothetical protein
MADDQNPHIRDEFSPLDALMRAALRRYGEFSTETIDGDVALMVIEMANEIIDDIRQHPYASAEDIALPYYTSLQDARPVNDTIIRSGLLARVADQQQSETTGTRYAQYYRHMNSLMWRKLNGNTAIHLRQVGDGTHPKNSLGRATSTINGLTPDEE